MQDIFNHLLKFINDEDIHNIFLFSFFHIIQYTQYSVTNTSYKLPIIPSKKQKLVRTELLIRGGAQDLELIQGMLFGKSKLGNQIL